MNNKDPYKYSFSKYDVVTYLNPLTMNLYKGGQNRQSQTIIDGAAPSRPSIDADDLLRPMRILPHPKAEYDNKLEYRGPNINKYSFD